MKNLKLYNIRIALTICTTTYAPFTDESLVHTLQELCTAPSSTKLTVGMVAHQRLSRMYCKIIDDTTEKKEMEVCESTEEGAMLLEDYALIKNWTLA